MKLLTYLVPTFLVLASSCSSVFDDKQPRSASAVVVSPVDKNLLANVKFHGSDDGVRIQAQATGLNPGAVHGIHIHEVGKCEGDFKSAGGHLNPKGHNHASPAAKVKHLGDLGNLVANDKGEAATEVYIGRDAEGVMEKLVGKSVIIHAKADDLASEPSGNSGERIACGIIEKTTVQ